MSFLLIDRMRLPDLRTSKIRGVQLAIVVDNKDGQGNPGYRVKLKFPWLSEQETTFWARIAVPMGGTDRGTYALPEIDDQVLVVFEHGDIDRPIVVGSLWNKQQEPVEVNQSGKNNTKLIKSRCGHRIIFDDKEGAEKITIVDRTKKNKIVLDSVNKVVKIESDGDVEVKAKTNVILHANALKVGTQDGITGKAASLLTHAQKTFGLKASSKITIGGGNTTINTSNAAACSVSGSGAGELGGAGEEAPRDQVQEQARAGASNASSGGGGGSSARPSTGADGERGAGPGPTPAVQDDDENSTTFFELVVIYDDKQPLDGKRYRVVTPDGTTREGTLDGSGKVRIDGIKPGVCQVSFPDLADDDGRANVIAHVRNDR